MYQNLLLWCCCFFKKKWMCHTC